MNLAGGEGFFIQAAVDLRESNQSGHALFDSPANSIRVLAGNCSMGLGEIGYDSFFKGIH